MEIDGGRGKERYGGRFANALEQILQRNGPESVSICRLGIAWAISGSRSIFDTVYVFGYRGDRCPSPGPSGHRVCLDSSKSRCGFRWTEVGVDGGVRVNAMQRLPSFG
jgi:hypothetical protein